MRPYFKITARCIACDNCRLLCPKKAIIKNGDEYTIDTHSCNLCHICVEACPVDCIKLEESTSKKTV